MFRCLLLTACLALLAFAAAGCKRQTSPSHGPSDRFLSLMNAGKNHLNQGDATNALAVYREAEALFPNDADVHLNLANAHLLAGAAREAIREADEVLQLEPNSAAAYFVKGSAYLRLTEPEKAVKALENTRKIDPGETATFFQLGLARMELQQWDEAIAAFREGIRLDPNRLHSAAHYLLAQALVRAGRREEAQEELLLHQTNLEGGGPSLGDAAFERSKFTQARVPFQLDQPDPKGINVRFVDDTEEVLGRAADRFSGPLAVIDPHRTGWNGLFATEPGRGFRILSNTNGAFHPHDTLHPAQPSANYSKMLVGDLRNDRFEDIVVLGDQGCHLFEFGTNGLATDVSSRANLSELRARDGTLMDLDFTGRLDLIAVAETESAREVRVYRQLQPLVFTNATGASGIPGSLDDARAVRMEDWSRDEIMDVIVGRAEGTPLLLEKQRGGPLVPSEPTNWVAGTVFTSGDFDNDLRPDLAVAGEGKLTLCFHGGERREIELPEDSDIRALVTVDYDNDGWLDLWALGKRMLVWRNRGLAGFEDRTAALGLDRFDGGAVAEIHFADFDMDCDSDAVVALANGGLRFLRNEGGNDNGQVKVRLVGNRSNASGLGCKVEIETGGLRLIRTVRQLPVEVGVGRHRILDSFLVHWFNWPQGSAQIPFDCREPILALELTVQEGSCPYLYAWDGERFRFITDFLGAAPLGLPVADGHYVEADPEEFVWIGDERTFPARDGHYELRITEELREVLYLDEAKLVVVDHEPNTEAHTTDKLRPSGPFPRDEILTLHREQLLQRAERWDGEDATDALRTVDGKRVSPPRMRAPQLRGLAESHGLVLDFGPLDASQPLVLVLNGWLRFGGGMANIAAARDPTLPFPFPTLEMEIAPGHWHPVDVTVGAPAGKTKTILVDLEGKLESGARRLRLQQAFEIHWDRIALMEKKPSARTQVTFVAPSKADLRFRGFSAARDLPPDWPITPDYEIVSGDSRWTIVPGGWTTRHGDVLELIDARDEGLALIHSGDELALRFAADSLPPKPDGSVREFFLYADGWDKDSDFHVAAGARIGPLPFHGMDYQNYGREDRPPFPSDALHRQYNTRWVEGTVLKRTAGR